MICTGAMPGRQLEGGDQVRVGLDDFSQSLLGPADRGQAARDRQSLLSGSSFRMALFRQRNRASFEAPVDGAIEAINPKVRQNPRLIHDDPYGEGWLFMVKPFSISAVIWRICSPARTWSSGSTRNASPGEPDGYPGWSHHT